MNDDARRVVVAALMRLADSRDWRDRADAGQAMASFAELPETRLPLLGLLLDAADTFVTSSTAKALLRRHDVAGLTVVARGLADADANHADWIHGAVQEVFGIYVGERDAAVQICDAMLEDGDEVLQRGTAQLREALCEMTKQWQVSRAGCTKFVDDPKCNKPTWKNDDDLFGTMAVCVSATASVGTHVWGVEGCVAGDAHGAAGVTFSTINGKSGNIGLDTSMTFQSSNAKKLEDMCGDFAYVGGGAASYVGSGFSGGGVQGTSLGRSAGLDASPLTVEHGTSDTRLVWVPGQGGNQCHHPS